jgi:hypothetical protein
MKLPKADPLDYSLKQKHHVAHFSIVFVLAILKLAILLVRSIRKPTRWMLAH